MNLTVSTDTTGASRFLRTLFRDQLPFATSKAINATATDFQREQRQHMRSIFTVRNKLFVDRSVKIKPFANKRRLEATVSILPPGGTSRADIIGKFEQGGFKIPRGRHLTVPDEVKRSKRGAITKAKRPRAFGFELHGRGPEATVFRGQKRTFMIVRRSGGGAIFKRSRKRQVKQLFSLTDRARIPASLDFEENARRTVNTAFSRRFDEAFSRAVRSAR